MTGILRWNLWGKDEFYLKMTRLSISSFYHYFKDTYPRFKYVLSCDNPNIAMNARIDHVIDNRGGPFFCHPRLFRQFCPDIMSDDKIDVEILIDSDVFCVREPESLFNFIDGVQELGIQSRRWGPKDKTGFGAWAGYIDVRVPPVCIGLLAMKRAYWFKEQLLNLLPKTLAMPYSIYNDQGAAAKAMEQKVIKNKVKLFCEDSITYAHTDAYPIDVFSHKAEMIHCIGHSKSREHYIPMIERKINNVVREEA